MDRLHEIIATQRDFATAELDLETVMELLCERTMELTGADGATVALLKDGELRIRRVARVARPPGRRAAQPRPSLGGLGDPRQAFADLPTKR